MASTQNEVASCEKSNICVSRCEAYGHVCPCAARAAGYAAYRAVKKLEEDSLVFHKKNETHNKNDCNSDIESTSSKVLLLSLEDIEIGEKLGEGQFCLANSCRMKRKTGHNTTTATGETGPSEPENDKEYAIKYLKIQAMVKQKHYVHGAAHMAVASKFLSVLNHPNIVKLYGIAKGGINTNIASGKERGFFIVIDKLYDTLEQKILIWRQEEENFLKHNGGIQFFTRMSHDYKEKRKLALLDRLRIAHDVANVMEYLHSCDIVFRDLKPDNVGFDKQGQVKLFDFGLAKELKESNKLASGQYKLTGHSGSLRYMAPEVAKDLPYNQSVDIFSFGILLWEMCTTENAYEGYSRQKHMQLVILDGERPKMDHHHVGHWPVDLQWLVKKCWSKNIASRPSFAIIKQTLNDILYPKSHQAHRKTSSLYSPESRPRNDNQLDNAQHQDHKPFWKIKKRQRQHRASFSPRALQHSINKLSLQPDAEKLRAVGEELFTPKF